MSKHTPGPWVAKDVGAFNLAAFDIESTAPGRRLVTCLASSVNATAERDAAMEADAHLIAAAPELLEALELLIVSRNLQFHTWDCDESRCVCDEVLRDARAAIKKAKGEA